MDSVLGKVIREIPMKEHGSKVKHMVRESMFGLMVIVMRVISRSA